MKRSGAALVLALVVASGCAGANHHAAPQAHAQAIWTSSAEPSPPGSAGRWTPADEEQLRESSR